MKKFGVCFLGIGTEYEQVVLSDSLLFDPEKIHCEDLAFWIKLDPLQNENPVLCALIVHGRLG